MIPKCSRLTREEQIQLTQDPWKGRASRLKVRRWRESNSGEASGLNSMSKGPEAKLCRVVKDVMEGD